MLPTLCRHERPYFGGRWIAGSSDGDCSAVRGHVWVYQVRDRQQETGVRSSFPIGGHSRSRLADREQVLRDWIAGEPDLTLAELQQRRAKQGVATKIATLWHQLNKWKLTFKKKPCTPTSKSAPTCRRRGANEVRRSPGWTSKS